MGPGKIHQSVLIRLIHVPIPSQLVFAGKTRKGLERSRVLGEGHKLNAGNGAGSTSYAAVLRSKRCASKFIHSSALGGSIRVGIVLTCVSLISTPKVSSTQLRKPGEALQTPVASPRLVYSAVRQIPA